MKRLVHKSALLYVSVALLAGCAPAADPQAAETPGIPVTAYRVHAQNLPETLMLPGRVVAATEAQAIASVPGRVDEVRAKPGDVVKTGQVLATLESAEGQVRLQEARRALAQLEAQYNQMQQTPSPAAAADQQIAKLQAEIQRQIREQTEQLTKLSAEQKLPDPAALVAATQRLSQLQAELFRLQSQSAAAGSLDAFRAPMLQQLQAQVAQARQAVALAEAQIGAANITSPIDGVVLAVNAAPGSAAAPGMPLYSIGNLPQVEMELLVDPNQQSRLQPGQAATLQVGNEQPVTSRLLSVSPAIQPQSKSFTARAALENPNQTFKPGMMGQATVVLAPHEHVLAIPKAALLTDDKGSYVMQIKNSQAVQTRVERGYDNGTLVEIKKGLAAEDQVVYEGVDHVQAGRKVHITRTEGTTTTGTKGSSTSLSSSRSARGAVR